MRPACTSHDHDFVAAFLSGPARVADALARLDAEDAVSLPLLDDTARALLIAATEKLTFRRARPVVGPEERQVLQDFDICMNPVPRTAIHDLADALERLTGAGLAHLSTPPLPAAPLFNDLAIQRYPAGSRGITPHRDHVRYRDLVAIVTLAGQARFFICADRSGRGAREIPMPPGSLVLMRAPGFAGRSERPFHMLSDISEPRVSLGIRHDTQPA